jgi:L-threonylcarbamoyladenylate synthase
VALVYLNINKAVQHLKAGAVLLMSTDTLPGLHCRADNPEAVAKIIALKGREADKSLLVLAGSYAQAATVLGVLTEAQGAACQTCWPGPFSFILPAGAQLAALVKGGRSTLAVRVPRRPDLCDLIHQVGVPLVSTSANRAGEPASLSLEHAAGLFERGVDGVWQGLSERPVAPKASALVDLTSDPFRVLRPGPEPFELG